MTDAEIIKAKAHFEYGIKCDIFKEPVLSYAKTVLEAFDEINRQKAEIERLLNTRVTNHSVEKQLKTAEAEAIKEFAERLHCHCQSIINEEWNKKVYPTSWADAYEEFDGVIDNLVKEMVGDVE